MGLVALSPVDMLASVVAAAQAPAGAGSPTTPPSAGFAALVAALLGDGETPTPAPGPALPLPKQTGKDNESDELAAILASTLAALQAAGAPLTPPQDAPQHAASSPDSAGTKAAALSTEILALVPAAGSDDAHSGKPAAPADNAAAENAAPVAPAPTAAMPAADPALAPTAAATSAVTATPTPQAAKPGSTQPTSLPPPPADDADDGSPHQKPSGLSASPPGPADIAELVSVVRSVGNAEQRNQTTGHGEDSHHDAPHQAPPADVSAVNVAAPLSAQLTLATAAGTPASAGGAAPAHIPPPVEQVAHAVIEQVQQGGGEAKLHLHPAELGEVVIHVHTDGDRVHVEVHADHAEAMNLLRDHTADLSNLLGGRGLNLADVYVGLGGQSASSNGHDQPSSQANSPAHGEFAAILGVDQPPTTIDTHLRLRAAYNPDGALSYRV